MCIVRLNHDEFIFVDCDESVIFNISLFGIDWNIKEGFERFVWRFSVNSSVAVMSELGVPR